MQARAGPRESFQWAGHKIGRFVQIAFKEPIISQFMIEIESVMNKFIRKKISADTKSCPAQKNRARFHKYRRRYKILS